MFSQNLVHRLDRIRQVDNVGEAAVDLADAHQVEGLQKAIRDVKTTPVAKAQGD
jgi:hypothetical protein